MKKLILMVILCVFVRPVFSFFPYFYGARSLALGYSSMAFQYDFNAIYLNPALLNTFSAPLGGYQFASSFLDYLDFAGQLQKISAFDLKKFQNLDAGQKHELLGSLKDVFSAKTLMNGFQIKNPGYAGKGYGLAVEFVDSAIIYPLANDVLSRPVTEITNADIASLKMRFIGFHYTKYSFSYAFSLGQGLSLGATIHYLKGKAGEFNGAIVDAPFRPASATRDYLQHAWSGAQKEFNKFNFDLGVSAELGSYFRAGLMMKNVGNPVIATEIRDLQLSRRLIAGLAFRPDSQWGIYLDIDVNRSDLYHNGQKVQPVSLGIEKGFFQSKLFLRAGFLNDLSEKYFLGRNAKAIYGIGLGFNLASFLVDFALGLDSLGHVKNLAISGFYLIK
jgi:hypothetical protein